MAIQNIFVVGAGLMGSGIAQNAVTSGYNVVLNDQRREALDRAKANIEKALARDVEKGRMTAEDRDAALARLTYDATLEGAKNADQRCLLQDRIRMLSTMLREARELAVLTERYYDRGYRRNAKYTI